MILDVMQESEREREKNTANQLRETFSCDLQFHVVGPEEILPKIDGSRQRRSPWLQIAHSEPRTNRTRPTGFSGRAALKEEIDETPSEG